MGERLAKRKAEQEAAAQAKANQALRFGVTNPPVIKKDKPWYEDIGSAIGGAIKSVYDNIPMSNPISTPINMGGNAGVSMGGQGTGKSLVTEPARLAVRRAVGDITAIPRVGEPSPSYTADQIREQGVARGVLGAAIDYSQFIPVVAKGAGVTGDVLNAYKLARMERTANPFPAMRGASNVIDVVEGSRLPARVIDAPIATPSERFGQALAERMNTAELSRSGARDAGTIRLPGGEPTPELPSSQLSQPAFRERQVPTSSRLTVETNGLTNANGTPRRDAGQEIIIRSFDQKTGKYTGALTISYDPFSKTATINGIGATNPMVTPQLISAGSSEIRKLVGDVKYPLRPDSNLSSTSRPFVERLQQAGLIDPAYKLPPIDELNTITKLSGPETFADENAYTTQTVIDPLSYQPTYNDVLRALVESKQKAKLEGEYGKLTTPSNQLRKVVRQNDVPGLIRNPNLNTVETYRNNMEGYGFPVHPLFDLYSNEWNNTLLDEIIYDPARGASILSDVWKKIDPAVVENLGPTWGPSFAPTKQNLLDFPDLLQRAYLIDGQTRQRLLVELENLLE
jgi:hypothetical protein